MLMVSNLKRVLTGCLVKLVNYAYTRQRMHADYFKRGDVGAGGVGAAHSRGVGTFWKRVLEDGDAVAGPFGEGAVSASVESVVGRGTGLEIRFEVGAGRRAARRSVWCAETVEVLSLRTGAKSIWSVEGLDSGQGEAGRVFLPLAVEESVSRLKVEFSRLSGFEEAELWQTPALALPRHGVAQEMRSMRSRVGGATISVHSLTAPGGVVPGVFRELWNRWTGDSSVFTLWAEVSPEGLDRRLTLVSAVDEQGQRAEVRAGLWSGEHYAFGLVPSMGSTRLSLTFALHRSRVVELVVDTRSPDGTGGQQN